MSAGSPDYFMQHKTTMELAKCKKFLKDDNYVHCSICGNYRNINSFSHRKSKNHQKKLAFRLRKIAFHLSKKKKIEVVIHDEQWQEKETKLFCHFCGQSYAEHCVEDEFVVEHLGSLYHHADVHHAEHVKEFLKRNFSEEKPEKYCIKQSDLDCFLKKIPEAKSKYLKKMDIINSMIVKQIKSSEEQRKNLIADTLQDQSSFSFQEGSPHYASNTENVVKSQPMLINKKNKNDVKVPPWLEDVPDTVEAHSSTPVIGPTLDTLVKHELNQRKKRFPNYRIGANFKHGVRGSSKWLPSFQGTWNKGSRKYSQNQFKWRNKKSTGK